VREGHSHWPHRIDNQDFAVYRSAFMLPLKLSCGDGGNTETAGVNARLVRISLRR